MFEDLVYLIDRTENFKTNFVVPVFDVSVLHLDVILVNFVGTRR